jgi:hypothetical protein
MKRLTLMMCLLTTMLLLASACQINTASTTHAAYIFTQMKTGPGCQLCHPGDAWTLKYQRKRIPDSDELVPTPIKITAQLIGPFSPEVADKNVRGGNLLAINGPVVVFQSITTNDWTPADAVIAFQLPKHLALGSYDFVESIRSGGESGARSTVAAGTAIQVVS